MTTPTRLFYLVRHGQTDWNAAGRWQGQTDIPLNAEGERQATALGTYLAQFPIDRVVSSDLERAAQTARLATRHHRLPIETDPRWREFSVGQLEGVTWAEMEAHHPHVVTGINTDWYGFTFPGGESRLQLQARVSQAFQDLLQDPRGQHVAVFTHGTSLRVLLARLFPHLYTDPQSHPPIHNTAVLIIEQAGDTLTLAAPPATPHLT
jgi:probable phosphoglycerate mutase